MTALAVVSFFAMIGAIMAWKVSRVVNKIEKEEEEQLKRDLW